MVCANVCHLIAFFSDSRILVYCFQRPPFTSSDFLTPQMTDRRAPEFRKEEFYPWYYRPLFGMKEERGANETWSKKKSPDILSYGKKF